MSHSASFAFATNRTLVLVVVAFVESVTVPFMEVVDVIVVDHSLVAARFTVGMVVARVFDVREHVLVVMAFVNGMGVALVDVVGVALVVGSGVPAAGPVLVGVVGMYGVVRSGHVGSLEWVTASETM